MVQGIRLPVKDNSFLEREITMVNPFCALSDRIRTIDSRLLLLQQQDKYLGLSPAKLLNLRNFMFQVRNLVVALTQSPPSGAFAVGVALEQTAKIVKMLGEVGSVVRDWPLNPDELVSDTVFTEWLEMVLLTSRPPPLPSRNIWASSAGFRN